MATDIISVWETWERYARDAVDQNARGVLHELCGLSEDQATVADYLGTARERKLVLDCPWLRKDIRRHANTGSRCPIIVVAGTGEPTTPGYSVWTEGRSLVEVGHQWVWEYFSTVSSTSG